MNNPPENMSIYNAVRTPPPEALKPITGGRLKGKSDINPMWRIKALTEQFGPAGIGWYYTIESQWLEPGAGGEIAAFCRIALYVRRNEDEDWSQPIPGIGGSMLVEKEKEGLHTNDECYKMALTDAIGVACKALGFAADVYWGADRDKYSKIQPPPSTPAPPPPYPAYPPQGNGRQRSYVCHDCGLGIYDLPLQDGRVVTAGEIYDRAMTMYGTALCADCQNRRKVGR